MFLLTPEGRVVVNDCSYRNRDEVVERLWEITPLFYAAVSYYHYGPAQLRLFSASLAYILPILLMGEFFQSGSTLYAPAKLYRHILRWGLALRYHPRVGILNPCKGLMFIELSAMSEQYTYREQLLRAHTSALAKDLAGLQYASQYGLERFQEFLSYNLRSIGRGIPPTPKESPVVHFLCVGGHIDQDSAGRYLGSNKLLLAGCVRTLACYYHLLDLEGVEVEFWDLAGLRMSGDWKEYLTAITAKDALQ